MRQTQRSPEGPRHLHRIPRLSARPPPGEPLEPALGGLQSCREPCTPAPSPAPRALHSPPHPHPDPEAQAPPGAQSCHRFAKQQRWPGAGAGFGRVGKTELEFWVGSRAGRSRSRADSSQLGRAGRGCYSSKTPCPLPPRQVDSSPLDHQAGKSLHSLLKSSTPKQSTSSRLRGGSAGIWLRR